MSTDRPLPEFDNPPISEVAWSVEFSPPPRWHAAFAGLFWSTVIEEYPHTDVQLPLPSQIERFGERWQNQPALRVSFADPDALRFWFIAHDQSHLIQIQRDRFILNWRKVDEGAAYPRYRAMRDRFSREWERFRSFIVSRELGEIEVRQCELTYVDDITQDAGWTTFADLAKVFSPWSGSPTEKFLPSPATLSVEGSFEMPDQRGRLHFATQHLLRSNDNKEVIQLRLVSRGKPASSDSGDVLEWMDLGHEWVVRGFADLTTAGAQRFWRRTR